METQKIKIKDVQSVYSGQDGKCCCGCSGTHYYNSQYVKEASKNRGYKVMPEEINDKMIKRVVNKINNNPDKVDCETPELKSIVIGKRLYIAYYVKI